jgi:hypothetical protein
VPKRNALIINRIKNEEKRKCTDLSVQLYQFDTVGLGYGIGRNKNENFFFMLVNGTLMTRIERIIRIRSVQICSIRVISVLFTKKGRPVKDGPFHQNKTSS